MTDNASPLVRLGAKEERVIIVGWCIVQIVIFFWDTGGESDSCSFETHVGHSILEISGKSGSRYDIGGIQQWKCTGRAWRSGRRSGPDFLGSIGSKLKGGNKKGGGRGT